MVQRGEGRREGARDDNWKGESSKVNDTRWFLSSDGLRIYFIVVAYQHTHTAFIPRHNTKVGKLNLMRHSLHLSVCLYDGCRLGCDGQFSTRRHHIHLSLPPCVRPSVWPSEAHNVVGGHVLRRGAARRGMVAETAAASGLNSLFQIYACDVARRPPE